MLTAGELCSHCGGKVNIAMGRDGENVSHTIRIWCGCKEATSIFNDADFYAGLTHNQAIDMVYYEWKKKNPASEESGVDPELAWKAVDRALDRAWHMGRRNEPCNRWAVLKEELDKLTDTDLRGPFHKDTPTPTRKP